VTAPGQGGSYHPGWGAQGWGAEQGAGSQAQRAGAADRHRPRRVYPDWGKKPWTFTPRASAALAMIRSAVATTSNPAASTIAR